MKKRIIKNIGPAGHRRRLRERFLKTGRKAFADYELIELLLTYAIPRVDTKPIAKGLLKEFKTIVNVFQQSIDGLQEVNGIGPEAATYIRLIHACFTRAMEQTVEYRETISTPEEIFSFVRLHLGTCPTECLLALYLNNIQHVVHHQDVSVGTVGRLPMYPREILKPALLHNATGIILVHNHPDGQPVPSENDMALTKKIEDISAMFDIKLIDHLIVTQLQAYSIKTGKLL